MSEERSVVSISVDGDLARSAGRFTSDLAKTAEELLTEFVARKEAPKRLEGEELIRFLDGWNAFHDEHGLLSDEFCMF